MPYKEVKRYGFTEKYNKEECDAKMMAILDAMPLCVNLWNSDTQNIMCNQHALDLFDLKREKDYLEDFFRLSPVVQPDGRTTAEASLAYINEARETGHCKFLWLHQKLSGEEIPCEITLNKVDILDDKGKQMVAGFTRDLRSQIAGVGVTEDIDGFFLNHISHKALFNTVAELSSEWFFAYDIKTSMIQYFGKGSEILGLTAEKQMYPSNMLNAGMVFEEDMDKFREMCDAMRVGYKHPWDIRFILPDESVRYFRITFKIIYDKLGKPIHSIGKCVDINDQKSFEILAQTDLLTNCYNKITSENLIKDTIARSEENDCHVMFIVDIDNFKAVNDNLGHHFGDLVLSTIASNLNAVFRNCDIVGRIGGDEFIVFVKNICNKKIIESKAEAIADAFKNTYSSESGEYKVSGSIGIAMYKEHGITYEDLYKAADKALYQSKLKGKDCYTFYSEEFADGTMRNHTILENANRIANSFFDTKLVSTVFDLLYETKEIYSSIDAILAFIGKRTRADRCYIFETFDNGITYDNTYEWCKDGIRPEIGNLKGVTGEVLADFFEDADGDGVLYSNDLTVLDTEGAYELMADQDIKSFLHAQTRENGYVKLFLGLDDCTNTRIWSEKDINSLIYAAKMISIFLSSDERKLIKFREEYKDLLSEEEIAVLRKLKAQGIIY